MRALIEAAIDRNRATLLALLFVMCAGAMAYSTIPKEAAPDVAIPMIFVRMSHDGISPEDAERLLVKPMERELRAIEGLDKLTATAGEGFASVLLEFDAGFDAKQALLDVREKVDLAKAELPERTDEPVVEEVNVALFPVLTLSLSGELPERQILGIARDLEEQIEALPGVLEVDIGGDREELVEVIVDPLVMETYGIDLAEVLQLISRNNQLIAAGSTDSSGGRLSLKVPGVIEDVGVMLKLPVKIVGDTVVTLDQVATIHRTFKDPEGFARVNGKPALVLEVKKRVGANIIETTEQVRQLVRAEQALWPAALQFDILQDKSGQIKTMLADLQNNVISAIVLVMLVVLAALGARSATLVGIAIPASFLSGMLVIQALGMTLNIVVLFSLILVVGMLVDGAIVVAELAERNLADGMTPVAAYAGAAHRMSWPIIASTATTLAVFAPLLFWPGVVGEFMGYLPRTVIICLSASMVAALVFIPVLGATFTRKRSLQPAGADATPSRLTGLYVAMLRALVGRPGLVIAASLLGMGLAYGSYALLGKGVEFFPSVEPESIQVHVHARGDLAIDDKDQLLREVEARIGPMDELDAIYARSFTRPGTGIAQDVIGVLQIQLDDWNKRRAASVIVDDLQQRIGDLPGVVLELRKEENGPSGGKPIQLEVRGRDARSLEGAVGQIRDLMDGLGGFAGTEDNRPLPGVEWRMQVDREEAARYGADVALVGSAVQMVTTGVKAADFRPEDTTEEVDIRVRFPQPSRNLGQLDRLHLHTARGMVPISNFVTLKAAPRTGTIDRVDGRRTLTIQSDVQTGKLVDGQMRALRTALAKTRLPDGVDVAFRGEDEDMRETSQFLVQASLAAMFLMICVLTLQFNSIYQTFLVLSAILLSTAGVLVGLIVTGQPFGVVMVGLGVIALAGIVVNNNIVLIDTYNDLRRSGLEPVPAAIETGSLRLRPVLLTAGTTVLGLLPMVLGINLDFVNRVVALGAPSTQWWTQLSTAIAGGLVFATVLTLAVTPCLLVFGERLFRRQEVSETAEAVAA